jgi:hypothetical protein
LSTIELAATVVVGTALVLAPIRPRHARILANAIPEPTPQPAPEPTPAPEPATVTNYDNYGSLWGHETIAQAEASVAKEYAKGTAIDEWDAVDRDGNRFRVVRMADPTFLDTIAVIPA